MVFDEAFSWWSSEKETLPDSDSLHSAQLQLDLGAGEVSDDDTA
jgi:hypothetical protein